jgi:UDP-N-acetylmuramate-alanine ligase
MSAVALAAAIDGPRAEYVPTMAGAVQRVCETAGEHDIVLTVGAGDIADLGPAILSALQQL